MLEWWAELIAAMPEEEQAAARAAHRQQVLAALSGCPISAIACFPEDASGLQLRQVRVHPCGPGQPDLARPFVGR